MLAVAKAVKDPAIVAALEGAGAGGLEREREGKEAHL